MKGIRRLLVHEGGFSLVEMVVASAILLFVVAVMLNAFIAGNIVAKRASKVAVGTNLARQKLELVKNKAYADVADETEADVGTQYPNFKWAVDVTYVEKDADGSYSEIASDKGLKKVIVTVSWSGEGKRDVQVAGIVANANLYSVQGSLSGYVTDGTNVFAGVTVATSDGLYSATTASDGSYSIDNIIAGTYTFCASKSGWATSFATEITVVAGATTDQDFTITNNPGAITGTIFHVATTNTIEGASVTTSPGSYTATTNSSGQYTLSNILPGDYAVTATANGYRYQRNYATVTGGSTTSDFDFELSPGDPGTGTITGIIRSESSSTVSGASVTANPGGHSTTSDALGTYTIENLVPGPYAVSAQATGYVETQAAGKTVSAGGTTIVDLTLKSTGGNVRGQVINNAGSPVQGVMVTLSGSSLSAVTGSDGNYIIEQVPAGSYNLTASTTSPSKSQTVSIEVYNGLETVKDFNTKDFN